MKRSAGMLMFRRTPALELLLVHPGGPFFRNKDAGAWSVPKGELADGEDALACAVREFREETGLTPLGPYLSLGEIKQKGGKVVQAWAFDGSALDVDTTRAPPSNTFELEWPPRSGRRATFPEVDQLGLFSFADALPKILPAQAELLQRLVHALGLDSGRDAP